MYSISRKYPPKVKDCKMDFIQFVNYYNSHKDELCFTDAERDALEKLHAMWKESNKSSTLDFYFEMKVHHTILNGKLSGYREIPFKLWCNYTDKFLSWSTYAEAQAHIAQRKQ
ncbi:unnamed protein product [Orchesella dallaii]|uniref:Uncharacterized protein n=1 Tax=Orchesella dallaii TaxID=48710 RepID=A0ABP1RA32_9HEXA